MSDIKTKTGMPDPTFLNEEDFDLRKPLGLVIRERQQVLQDEPKGARLSRKAFETMLDDYYDIDDVLAPDRDSQHNHARTAGGRMVRNLALASCLALLLGFGLGLYGLSKQGAETQIGQQFNKSLASLWQFVQPQQTDVGIDLVSNPGTGTRIGQKAGQKTGQGTKKSNPGKLLPSSFIPKPIKTASLVVNDASGTLAAGIPLKLVLNTDVDLSLMQVKIMNVPQDAVLTAGTRRHDGVWILQPAELKNVSLVVSSDRKSPLRLEVELVEKKTGELLSPTREIKVAILQPRRFEVGGL